MASAEPTRLTVPDEEAYDRYHRQSLISWWDQERLSTATILVVGAGALGNELVKNLVLMGVGRILVADMDKIEYSNLARCVFFRKEDEGRFKAEVLASRATELNPEVAVIPLVGDIRLAAGLGVFNEVDVVLGGLDNREARLFVNQACWKTSTPWVDGAIEGLMGVVRVFVPPESACYECTMNERDRELIAARRTCALLTREEMLSGKVPTTATTSSVIAAMQTQEAVKLLHTDRLGEPTLTGGGFHFVGLTHDSYVVRYARREDCYSHDTYELNSAVVVDHNTRFGELLDMARERLGSDAMLELEQELVVSAECGQCGHRVEILKPVESLNAGSGRCPECGNEWRLVFAHTVDEESPIYGLRPVDLALPPGDVVVGRLGLQRCFFLMTGPGTAIDLVGAKACA